MIYYLSLTTWFAISTSSSFFHFSAKDKFISAAPPSLVFDTLNAGIIFTAYFIAQRLFFSLLKNTHEKMKVLLVVRPNAVACCRGPALSLNLGGSLTTYSEFAKNLRYFRVISFSKTTLNLKH